MVSNRCEHIKAITMHINRNTLKINVTYTSNRNTFFTLDLDHGKHRTDRDRFEAGRSKEAADGDRDRSGPITQAVPGSARPGARSKPMGTEAADSAGRIQIPAADPSRSDQKMTTTDQEETGLHGRGCGTSRRRWAGDGAEIGSQDRGPTAAGNRRPMAVTKTVGAVGAETLPALIPC
jgi:hypothetical protein